MAQLVIAGVTVDIAPYKIGAMRRAAPFIDRINITAGSMTSLEGMVSAQSDMIAVLAIGLQRIDPKYTTEFLDEELGLEDLSALRDCFTEILAASGLKRGEAEAPQPGPEPVAEALPISSDASSTTSSPPE